MHTATCTQAHACTFYANVRPAQNSYSHVLCAGDDALPERDLELAEKHCRKADLVICLGTSLRVAPANGLPLLGRRMVICNLQATAKDRYASLIINAPCDTVMELLMKSLELPIPEYHRREQLLVSATAVDAHTYRLRVTCPSARDTTHCAFVRHLTITTDNSSSSSDPPQPAIAVHDQPFEALLRWPTHGDGASAAVSHQIIAHLSGTCTAPTHTLSFSAAPHELPKQQVFELDTVVVNYNEQDLAASYFVELDSSANGNGRRKLNRQAKITAKRKKKPT